MKITCMFCNNEMEAKSWNQKACKENECKEKLKAISNEKKRGRFGRFKSEQEKKNYMYFPSL